MRFKSMKPARSGPTTGTMVYTTAHMGSSGRTHIHGIEANGSATHCEKHRAYGIEHCDARLCWYSYSYSELQLNMEARGSQMATHIVSHCTGANEGGKGA